MSIDQEKAIAQLVYQADRLRDYALRLRSLVYLASGPDKIDTVDAVLAMAGRSLEPTDLDISAPTDSDGVRLTFTIPRRVYEYWAETFTGEVDEEIREQAIETYRQDQG